MKYTSGNCIKEPEIWLNRFSNSLSVRIVTAGMSRNPMNFFYWCISSFLFLVKVCKNVWSPNTSNLSFVQLLPWVSILAWQTFHSLLVILLVKVWFDWVVMIDGEVLHSRISTLRHLHFFFQGILVGFYLHIENEWHNFLYLY